jgi:hypothetical protein
MTRQNGLRLTVFALLATVALWLFMPSPGQGEGWRFIQAKIRESPEVRSRVGQVLNVRKPLFGAYSYRLAGTNETLELRLVAAGANSEVQIDAKASATGGNWEMVYARVH